MLTFGSLSGRSRSVALVAPYSPSSSSSSSSPSDGARKEENKGKIKRELLEEPPAPSRASSQLGTI